MRTTPKHVLRWIKMNERGFAAGVDFQKDGRVVPEGQSPNQVLEFGSVSRSRHRDWNRSTCAQNSVTVAIRFSGSIFRREFALLYPAYVETAMKPLIFALCVVFARGDLSAQMPVWQPSPGIHRSRYGRGRRPIRSLSQGRDVPTGATSGTTALEWRQQPNARFREPLPWGRASAIIRQPRGPMSSWAARAGSDRSGYRSKDTLS
jgi:hypothetical protein